MWLPEQCSAGLRLRTSIPLRMLFPPNQARLSDKLPACRDTTTQGSEVAATSWQLVSDNDFGTPDSTQLFFPAPLTTNPASKNQHCIAVAVEPILTALTASRYASRTSSLPAKAATSINSEERGR